MFRYLIVLPFFVVFSCAPRRIVTEKREPSSFERWIKNQRPLYVVATGRVSFTGKEEKEFNFQFERSYDKIKLGLFGPLGVQLGMLSIEGGHLIYKKGEKVEVVNAESLGLEGLLEILDGHFEPESLGEIISSGDTLIVAKKGIATFTFVQNGKIKELLWSNGKITARFGDFYSLSPFIPRYIEIRNDERIEVFVDRIGFVKE